MKYEKLIFIYPFNIGSFLNAKVGLEATLEEGDNLLECFEKLSSELKTLAAKEQGIVYDAPPMNHFLSDEFGQMGTNDTQLRFTKPREVQIEKSTEEEFRSLEEQILSCQEMKVLESYKLIVKKNPGLLLAYQKMEQQLQKQTQTI